MAEFLLELRSEEIPARMQRRAAEDLKRLVTDGLKKARLEFTSADAYVTPRRLILVVDGLPERQPDLREERKGPKVGAPDKAIAGFLRGAGLESLDQCEKRDTAKGEAWFAVIERKGAATETVFRELLNDVFAKFPWPKSMRWGSEPQRWVRPVHGVLCVFANRVVENIGFNDIVSGGKTVGHRFVSPDPIAVTSFADYREKLREASVMIDPAERRAVIESGLEKLAAAEGLTVKDDPALLDEVAGLVEWPVPLLGGIDADFMDLPAEALTSSMRAHQKYFALLKPDGSLAQHFGFVANIAAADGGKAIVAGNERVLRARLADAKFFWDKDRKTPLADRAPKLEAIVFHAKLGSVADKVQRIAALAADLADDANATDARQAALLCKADLVTGMVAEFPDLQGVMGRYYALADGESAAVADAIADHYAPQGPNDDCPSAPVSVAVALADKIDTLAGFWLIDRKPTGSKDPFALRRAALGVIRLVLENRLRINLIPVFEAAMRGYEGGDPAASGDLLGFFADRLKVHLRGQGVRHDLIAAIFALGDEDDLVRLLARVEALGSFLGTEDGENLLVAYRRAANIVRIETKKDGSADYRDVSATLFAQPEENALWQNLRAVRDSQKRAFAREQFETAMETLASLRPYVDNFFDQVTVNADETKLRQNRLALLKQIVVVMNRSADFSRVEG